MTKGDVTVSITSLKPWSNGLASSGKLSLRRHLRWVAKRTGKLPHKYTQVARKTHFKADISCISLANNRLMDITQLALTWLGRQMVKNLFDLNQSERKSSQVNGSARKAWPNGVTSNGVTPFGQGLNF